MNRILKAAAFAGALTLAQCGGGQTRLSEDQQGVACETVVLPACRAEAVRREVREGFFDPDSLCVIAPDGEAVVMMESEGVRVSCAAILDKDLKITAGPEIRAERVENN